MFQQERHQKLPAAKDAEKNRIFFQQNWKKCTQFHGDMWDEKKYISHSFWKLYASNENGRDMQK